MHRRVLQCYASGSSAALMHEINHLQNITLKGGQIETFQNNWIMAMSELKKTPDPEIAQYLYRRQLSASSHSLMALLIIFAPDRDLTRRTTRSISGSVVSIGISEQSEKIACRTH